MSLEVNYYLHRALEETFDSEVKKILKLITNRYGEDFCFTYDELLNFYQECELRISYKPKSTVAVKQSLLPDSSDRCLARTWFGGFYQKKQNKKKEIFGGRCQRKKISGISFCRQHHVDLVHGRVDKPPSNTVKGIFINFNDKSRDDL